MGKGAFGDVYKVRDLTEVDGEVQGKVFAMKVIERKKLRMCTKDANANKESLHLINECKALQKLHHPNIVQLKEVIDDGIDKNLYLVM